LAKGACFGEVAGWERPNWYAPAGVKAEYEYSYGRQNWFDYSAQEHAAVRNAVGLFDQSSFAKFLVQGPDAEKVLNHLSANNVSVPVGKVVYTQWLNARGGIEADLTITREALDRYLVVSAAATQTRDFAWLNRNIDPDARATAVDVSSSMAVLGVMGPRSRELISLLRMRICLTQLSLLAPHKSLTSPTRGCGQAALPMSVNWVGRFTFRLNSHLPFLTRS